jgi:L-threonylcarbamoyladenylate synthase
MKVVKVTPNNIDEVAEKAVDALLKGGLIVYPTETCYGLGVDVTNEAAVEKLWLFKGERGDKPVLIAVDSEKMAGEYAELTELFNKVAQKYWPGPVSMVVTSKNKVAEKVQGGKGTIGLRMPDSEIVLSMVGLLGRPITSTSANVSGGSNPYSLEQFIAETPVEKQDVVDLFIDAGTIPTRLPSTIVEATGGEIGILRQGEIEVTV